MLILYKVLIPIMKIRVHNQVEPFAVAKGVVMVIDFEDDLVVSKKNVIKLKTSLYNNTLVSSDQVFDVN